MVGSPRLKYGSLLPKKVCHAVTLVISIHKADPVQVRSHAFIYIMREIAPPTGPGNVSEESITNVELTLLT